MLSFCLKKVLFSKFLPVTDHQLGIFSTVTLVREQNFYSSYFETFLEGICTEMVYDYMLFIMMFFNDFYLK